MALTAAASARTVQDVDKLKARSKGRRTNELQPKAQAMFSQNGRDAPEPTLRQRPMLAEV
jgi:hypothetical protein